jgi:tetratricopeptide (TPR) repeat protein
VRSTLYPKTFLGWRNLRTLNLKLFALRAQCGQDVRAPSSEALQPWGVGAYQGADTSARSTKSCCDKIFTPQLSLMSKDHKEAVGEVETALLDAELFIKYGSTDRAMKRLKTALEHNPRSIPLRERLREVAAAHKHPEEAARHCLALASLYIERDDFDAAHDRLLEAKQLDPRISIASGLEAIRRARHPERHEEPTKKTEPQRMKPGISFAGDLSVVSVFDAIQAIENSRLTGVLTLTNNAQAGRVLFNDGQIVGAESGKLTAKEAFRQIVEITGGAFDFQKSAQSYPITIEAASNTNLILDSLRQVDEDAVGS